MATITAGVATSFTITAKDESGSLRTSGGDAFNVELEGTRSITGSVVDQLSGQYTVSYTATQSGSYEAAVKLAQGKCLTCVQYSRLLTAAAAPFLLSWWINRRLLRERLVFLHSCHRNC